MEINSAPINGAKAKIHKTPMGTALALRGGCVANKAAKSVLPRGFQSESPEVQHRLSRPISCDEIMASNCDLANGPLRAPSASTY